MSYTYKYIATLLLVA